MDLNNEHKIVDFMQLYDYFWSVNIFAKLKEWLFFEWYLLMGLWGTQTMDNVDHHDDFIVQLVIVGSIENSQCRKGDHMAGVEIGFVNRVIRSKLNMIQ